MLTPLRIISASSLAARIEMWSERTGKTMGPEDVEPATWARAEESRQYTAVQLQAAHQRLLAGVGRTPEWWSDYNLLITPTMNQPMPLQGLQKDDIGKAFGIFTMPFSISGQPAISLPLHWTKNGLPIGVQLVADFGREDLLLKVASIFEQELSWKARLESLQNSLNLKKVEH